MAFAALLDSIATAADGDDARGYTLAKLVEEQDASVRLANSVAAAARAGTLPLRTVGEYIDAGVEAEPLMLREVRNLGRKTARELSALVRDVASRAGAVAEVPEPKATDRREEVLALIGTEGIGILAADEILSARLVRILALPSFAERTLAEVLDDFPLVVGEMLRVPNCGRKSVGEFRSFCHRHAERRLRAAGRADGDALAAALLGGRAAIDDPTAATGVPAEPAPLAVPGHCSLAERLEWLISELPARAQVILRRRSGVGQPECETLEEIGVEFGVTRERIRQIEAKSLKRLAVRARRAPLRGLMLGEALTHWDRIAVDAVRLRRAELPDARRRLDPHLRLALDIEGMSLDAWLDMVAHPLPFGWLSPREDPSRVEEAAGVIGDLADVPIPMPLAGLPGGGDGVAAGLAAELVRDVDVRCGYLMPRRVGARSTRLIRLHAILASTGAVLPAERLVDRYRLLHRDDLCHERDAEIVMHAAPHLFLEIEDGCWAAVNVPGVWVEPRDAPATPRARVEEPGTIAHALLSTLRLRGPTRLSELLDEAGTILPEGRSVNSIGPVLLTRRELFVRALPGVYALHEQITPTAERLSDGWPVLFNDAQARLYVLARYAGEPHDIFPMWSPAAERALCRWARHSGGPGILTSLLSIAEIDEWRCGEDERDEWRLLQRHQGRYELGSGLRHAAAYERPDLDRVYAACRHVAEHGALSYCAANRLTGRKIDSHVGAGLVAVLLRLGALEEVCAEGFRWQRRHRAAAPLGDLLLRFEKSFARAVGMPDWSSPLGRELSDEIRAEWEHSTWVDAEALSSMFDGDAAATFDDSEDDPLARLMAEQRRKRDAERREATLDWLLTP